jgi:soluble lytic murein transglycosylase
VKSLWPIVICVLLAVDAAAVWFWMESRAELAIDPLVHEAAMKYHVQPALIKAVIWKESRFNPDARGLAGEIGLMQIMGDAASDWSKAENIVPFHHEHLTHPGSNTMAGTWYLRKALERYTDADNCLPYALAEYNAGRGNVLRWNKGAAATNSRLFIKQIDFPGTKSYVLSVMTRYAEYLPEYGISTRSRVETALRD